MLVKVENKRKCVLASMQKYLCRRFCLGTSNCVETDILFTFFSCYLVFSVVLTKKKNLDFVMWVFPKVAKTRMMSSVKLPRHCVWGACLVWAPLRSEAEALTDHLGLHSRVPF